MNKYFIPELVPHFTATEYMVLMPVGILLVTALLVLLLAAAYRPHHQLASRLCFLTSFLGLSLSLMSLPYMGHDAGILQNHIELNHGLKGIFSLVILGSLLALGIVYIQDQLQKFLPEFYALTLFSLLGMFFIIFSKHMMLTFIALELMSLSVYILVSLKRNNASSAEAGFKYFILGGLAACFILYGIVLLFGATGTFDLQLMSHALSGPSTASLTLAKVGGIFILCGLLFKVGAFPFHFWVPDVYQGSPASLSGWMSSIIKMSSFVLLVKFSMYVFFVPNMLNFFSILLTLVAILTMFAGNLLALQQYQLKRLLAYSSVAHTGYMLVAVVASGSNPKSLMTLFIYLTVYTVLSLTTFGVLAIWENNRTQDLTLDHIAGVGRSEKLPALLFVLASLGLAGIPLTAGFVGKFLLITEAMSGRQAVLCILLVFASLIGAYYYLRLFYYMYLRPTFERMPLSPQPSLALWTPMIFLSIINIFMGVAPQFIVTWLTTRL